MKRPLVILGTGTFAEEVADIAAASDAWQIVGFVEGIDEEKCGSPFLGRPVYWIGEVGALAADVPAICAVGSTRRQHLVEEARAAGLTFATLVHPAAQVFATATLGEGVIVSAGVVIGAATRIGAHTLVNRGSLIGHHVQIGNYTTIGPGCNIAAKTTIGHGTHVGMGATILDRITVGSGCAVAARALVSRDLPDRVQATGAPARIIKRGIERV